MNLRYAKFRLFCYCFDAKSHLSVKYVSTGRALTQNYIFALIPRNISI